VPELPEVEALALFLTERAGGLRVVRAELGSLSALKTYDPPLSTLVGRTVAAAERRGKYLCTAFSGGPDLWLVVHLARAGWLHWRDNLPVGVARPGKGPLALRIGLSDGAGFDLTEQGTEKRLAVWVVSDPSAVEGISRLGPEPLAPGFDEAVLATALAKAGGQLKSALSDQSVLAGVGNAYSDEVLWAAKLSPFKSAARLSPAELGRLHAALVGVLRSAVERSLGEPAAALKDAKRTSMSVHARGGQPCPACGARIMEVHLANRSFQYCPTCQTGGKVLADRRLSRLLK
jgi:formamidopyrimidine-DNA glycosylase